MVGVPCSLLKACMIMKRHDIFIDILSIIQNLQKTENSIKLDL